MTTKPRHASLVDDLDVPRAARATPPKPPAPRASSARILSLSAEASEDPLLAAWNVKLLAKAQASRKPAIEVNARPEAHIESPRPAHTPSRYPPPRRPAYKAHALDRTPSIVVGRSDINLARWWLAFFALTAMALSLAYFKGALVH